MNTREYYESKAPHYGINAGRLWHIIDVLPNAPARILDIGCAGGELAQALKARGYRVWGTDISEKALEAAMPHLEGGFQFDLTDEQWPAELMMLRFDVIIASEVIEHLFDPLPFIERLKSLLASGGHLIVTTPNFSFWKNRFRILFGRFRYEKEGLLDFGHIRFFTLPTARELFERAGYRIEREHHYYPNLEHRRIGNLGPNLPGLLAYQLIFNLLDTGKLAHKS